MVVIRGGGVVSAMGAGWRPLVAGIAGGDCVRLPAIDIGYPNDPIPLISRVERDLYPLSQAGAERMLFDAVDQALAECGERGSDPFDLTAADCALLVGSGGFLYASGAELYRRRSDGANEEQPFHVCGPGWGASVVSRRYGMRGPMLSLSTGCTSSANALLTASEMLQRGKANRALVLGAEGVSAVTLSGFEGLMLLDPDGCRPFDVDRNGLQLGEGAAALLLERTDRPPTPGLWCLRGGANLCDTHHLTSASPTGEVMRDVMREALMNAGCTGREVVLIKAHGTGSVDSDHAEASALRAVFGAKLPPITGLKRYFGHTLGACGTIESLALMRCIDAGWAPPAAGFTCIDPELDIAPLRGAIDAPQGPVLLNFFGFGGNYTSLVLERG